MGLVEFSLQEGVSRYLHCFINPPDIPVGYSYLISRNSKETHCIDWNLPEMNEKAAKNYSLIGDK